MNYSIIKRIQAQTTLPHDLHPTVDSDEARIDKNIINRFPNNTIRNQQVFGSQGSPDMKGENYLLIEIHNEITIETLHQFIQQEFYICSAGQMYSVIQTHNNLFNQKRYIRCPLIMMGGDWSTAHICGKDWDQSIQNEIESTQRRNDSKHEPFIEVFIEINGKKRNLIAKNTIVLAREK